MDSMIDEPSLVDKKSIWSETYRIDSGDVTSFTVRECEVKPCRQIVLLRYPE